MKKDAKDPDWFPGIEDLLRQEARNMLRMGSLPEHATASTAGIMLGAAEALAELRSIGESQEARIRALESGTRGGVEAEGDKPRRGRPRKAEAAMAESTATAEAAPAVEGAKS